ncbi:IS1595 family transposase [Methylomonas sp. TEB]|uniref:IS1595 family transposase n=1 Tax=Methylomonas sp. TEB TaxID=3398229 RepID=UPI0039F4BACF
MAQHFLLSAKARSMSLMQIFTMTDEAAFNLFKESRWGDGDPVCPCCGSIDAHYFIRTRKQWRCKDCKHTFSITSGTLFANHKLPLRIYLAAIALYTNTAKGFSALQLSRDLDVQYKTAFVLMHKIRESLIDTSTAKLAGEVEIDGAYVNAYVRPRNEKADRIDLRLTENQNPNKRCIITIRERGETGAAKTKIFVVKSENQADMKRLVEENVDGGATIHADEAKAYDQLHAKFDMKRINHQERYKGKNGECTNQAESFFSRFRRMHKGQVHQMGGKHLAAYANECAYREDTRRWSTGEIFADLISRCAKKQTSRNWCGYWQGNKAVDRLYA